MQPNIMTITRITTSMAVLNCLSSSASSETVAEAVEAWRKRQNLVQTARFSLQATQRLPARQEDTGTLVLSDSKAARDRNSTKNLQSNYSESISLRGLDGAARIFSSRAVLNSARDALRGTKRTVVYDGKDHSRELLSKEHFSMDQGLIHKPNMRNREIINVRLRPIFLTFRMLNANITGLPGATKFKIAHEGVINGRQLSVMENREQTTELWVDPTEEFVVRRYVISSSDGTPRAQIDIDYVLDEQAAVHVPSKWTCVVLDRQGNVSKQDEMTVDRYEINPIFPEDEFTLTFEPGTIVTDFRKGKDAHWYIDSDGAQHPVARENWAAVVRDGPDTLHPTRTKYVWLFLGSVSVLIVIIGTRVIGSKTRT